MIKNTYDAIVVGAGMSGGWAAKEFCDQGIKTLLLERGPNVEHIKDYPTANTMPWEFKHRRRLTEKEIKENPIISKCYAFKEDSKHFFVKDDHHKYIQKKPFKKAGKFQSSSRRRTSFLTAKTPTSQD